MDQWLMAVTSDPAAKGSAKDLEVAGAGPVHCHFSLLSLPRVVPNVIFQITSYYFPRKAYLRFSSCMHVYNIRTLVERQDDRPFTGA